MKSKKNNFIFSIYWQRFKSALHNFLVSISLLIIRTYQYALSPDHSWLKVLFPHGVCRYHPTCSTYAHQALKKYGLRKGWSMAIKRIRRCSHKHPGGVDLP